MRNCGRSQIGKENLESSFGNAKFEVTFIYESGYIRQILDTGFWSSAKKLLT